MCVLVILYICVLILGVRKEAYESAPNLGAKSDTATTALCMCPRTARTALCVLILGTHIYLCMCPRTACTALCVFKTVALATAGHKYVYMCPRSARTALCVLTLGVLCGRTQRGLRLGPKPRRKVRRCEARAGLAIRYSVYLLYWHKRTNTDLLLSRRAVHGHGLRVLAAV